MKIKLLLFAVLVALLPLTLDSAKKPEKKRVYMFGFAASFTDSLAFQTEIQAVDSVWLLPNGFLVDRALYSLQLQYYVEGKGSTNSTATVFFAEKAYKLKKVWEKVRKRYEKADGVSLTIVPQTDFQFRPEQYNEPTIDESE